MVAQSLIAEVIESQNENWLKRDTGTERTKLSEVKIYDGFACIITGIRRCGKSTLLRQLLPSVSGKSLFINFEDPRLSGFEKADFRRLDKEVKERDIDNLFFDEIQMLDSWELYARQKLDEGYKTVITGSNASLLSKELGTKLTGRHLSHELFPFSYTEFLSFEKKKDGPKAMESYMKDGGFPEFLRVKDSTVLHNLLDDILMRDIAVRYGIRDAASLRNMAVYLISNIGKPVSANNLSSMFQIKSTSTILEYLSYLQDAYLLQFIPKFSYSLKVQTRNPKKVYTIDPGFYSHNTTSFSDDFGRQLENAVFLFYRQSGREIFYFSEKRECDFLVFDKGKIQQAVQVCWDLHQDNLDREIEGLTEALEFFKLKKGFIVTYSQEDEYEVNGKKIEVIPIRKLLLGKIKF